MQLHWSVNSNDIIADKESNNSDKESDSESNEGVNEEVVLLKKKMVEKKYKIRKVKT